MRTIVGISMNEWNKKLVSPIGEKYGKVYALLQTVTGCVSQQSGKHMIKCLQRGLSATLACLNSEWNWFFTCFSWGVIRGHGIKGAKNWEEWKTSPLSSLIHEEEEATVPWMRTVGYRSNTRVARPSVKWHLVELSWRNRFCLLISSPSPYAFPCPLRW